MVIHFGQAERCLRQKSWKVAFEPKNPESRKRHKFFRFVHVTGQEAFEFICIYMLRCKRRWYSANSPFRSMIGRVFLCTQTGRLRMQSNRSPVVNKKKNSKTSQSFCVIHIKGGKHEQRTKQNLRSKGHRGPSLQKVGRQRLLPCRGRPQQKTIHNRDATTKHHRTAAHGTCP